MRGGERETAFKRLFGENAFHEAKPTTFFFFMAALSVLKRKKKKNPLNIFASEVLVFLFEFLSTVAIHEGFNFLKTWKKKTTQPSLNLKTLRVIFIRF